MVEYFFMILTRLNAFNKWLQNKSNTYNYSMFVLRYMVYNLTINFGMLIMNINAICQTLQLSSLTTEFMAKLVAQFAQDQITVVDQEVCSKYGDFHIILSTADQLERCNLSISDNLLHICPSKSLGGDSGDFNLHISDKQTADEWVKIAMAFIKDVLWIGKNEFYFEIYDLEEELIHDSFKTKSLIHALYKAHNLYSIPNVDSDDIHKVMINIDNEDCEDRTIIFNAHDLFFNLCDGGLKPDDLILALIYIEALAPKTTYSVRTNMDLGIELNS